MHQYEVMCIGLLFCCIWHCCLRVHAGGVTVMDTYVRGLVKGLQTGKFAYIFSHTIQKLGSAIGIVTTLVISLLVFWRKTLLCYDDRISSGHLNNPSCE